MSRAIKRSTMSAARYGRQVGKKAVTRGAAEQQAEQQGQGNEQTAFVPSRDWQDVPDGVVLSPGLQIRVDLDTGTPQARLPPEGQAKPEHINPKPPTEEPPQKPLRMRRPIGPDGKPLPDQEPPPSLRDKGKSAIKDATMSGAQYGGQANGQAKPKRRPKPRTANDEALRQAGVSPETAAADAAFRARARAAGEQGTGTGAGAGGQIQKGFRLDARGVWQEAKDKDAPGVGVDRLADRGSGRDPQRQR